MSNIEFLTDAQSEMVAGGAYLGTSANWVALSNIGSSTAVGGSPQTLGRGRRRRSCHHHTAQHQQPHQCDPQPVLIRRGCQWG